MRLEAHYVKADASKVAISTSTWCLLWEARHLDKTAAEESCWAAEKAFDQAD